VEEHDAKPLPPPVLEPAYLLISPLLPPSSLIAYSLGLRGHQKEEFLKKLSAHPSLAVYGGSDMFTSARRLRPWAQGISRRPNSRFTFVEVEGAGHFWHDPGVDGKLRLAVREWIKGLEQ
jgi:pimeloyl-ACP methyl ester carboxylesterase